MTFIVLLGLPAGFNEYYGYHYLLGGSVRCVHDQ